MQASEQAGGTVGRGVRARVTCFLVLEVVGPWSSLRNDWVSLESNPSKACLSLPHSLLHLGWGGFSDCVRWHGLPKDKPCTRLLSRQSSSLRPTWMPRAGQGLSIPFRHLLYTAGCARLCLDTYRLPLLLLLRNAGAFLFIASHVRGRETVGRAARR